MLAYREKQEVYLSVLLRLCRIVLAVVALGNLF